MITRRRALIAGTVLGATSLLSTPSVLFAQQKKAVSISRQLGVLYMPTHVMESQKLIEKHAERLGLSGVTVNWMSFANSSAQQDALLSGGVDVINSGAGPLLLLWDRTKGRVKGISACSAQPVNLITHDPRIQSLKDYREGDKIAVPTIRISTQAILLQMAARQEFGDDKVGYFDPLTVQLGHGDAYVAMRNPTHEIRSHFAAPPFDFYEMQNVSEARIIARSSDVIGGPLVQGQFMAMTSFADQNEIFLQALRAAGEEAKAFIESDLAAAVEIYKTVTGDKTETETIVEMFRQPGMMQWELYPQGLMKFAEHLHFVGTMKSMPGDWKDTYYATVHDLPGN